MVRASRVGFGTGPFGDFRFGWGDWAEIVLVHYMPTMYMEADAKDPKQPLRRWLNGIKPVFQELREALEFLPTVRDPAACPIAVLPFLANDVGYVDDPSQAEDRRRSAVFDAWQLYLNKGTAKGYAIIGAFNNVLVTVEGLYEDPCGSEVLTESPPALFQLHFDDIPADVFSRMFDDFVTDGGETALPLRFNSVTALGTVQFASQPGTDYVVASVSADSSLLLAAPYTGPTNPATVLVPASAITGTVSLVNGSAAVLGAGTMFGAFALGQTIQFSSQPGVNYIVAAIAGPTNMTLSSPFSGPTGVGVSVFPTASIAGTVAVVNGQMGVTGAGTTFATPFHAPTLVSVTSLTVSDQSEKTVTTLVVGVDYTVNLATGIITLAAQPATKTLTAVGGETSIALTENALTASVLATVDSVTLNGAALVAGVDFVANTTTGIISLTTAAVAGAVYVVSYHTNSARRGVRYRAHQNVTIFMDLYSTDDQAFWPLTGDAVPLPFSVQLTFIFPATAFGSVMLTLPYRSLTDPVLVSVDSVTRDGNVLAAGTDYAVSLPTGEIQLLEPNGVPVQGGSLYEVAATLSSVSTRCRTSLLRVNLSRVPGAMSELPAGVNDIIAKIATFKPLHVAFQSFSYDTSLPVGYGLGVALETRPLLASLAPNTGTSLGGTAIIITGNQFIAGTTITIGGSPLVDLVIVNETTITGVTPAHAVGSVDVAATSADGTTTLVNGFTYV